MWKANSGGIDKMKKLPNIILITADSLRADHCSFLGGKRHLTPFLSKLVSESLVFENVYANGPMTAISFPAIMTGTLPIFKMSTKVGIRITISEVLSRIGYVTLGYISSNSFAEIFSGGNRRYVMIKNEGIKWYIHGKLIKYVLSLAKASLKKDKKAMKELVNWLSIFLYNITSFPYDFLRAYVITSLAKLLVGQIPDTIPSVLDRKVVSLALSSLKVVQKKLIGKRRPFFLWIHFMNTHLPYGFFLEDPWRTCLENLKEKALVNRVLSRQKASPKEIAKLRKYYELGVKEFDRNLSHLFKGMEELGILEDTVIFITSDHGEELFEHGGYGHPPVKLYDENLRIPLVIWGVDEKERRKDLVSSVDIFPTILDFPGIRDHKISTRMKRIVDGRSLIAEEQKHEVISEGIEGGRIFVDVLLGKKSKIIVPGVKVAVRATNEEGHCIIENVVGKPDIKVVECTNEDLVEVCKKRLMEILGRSDRERRLELLIEAIRAAYGLR